VYSARRSYSGRSAIQSTRGRSAESRSARSFLPSFTHPHGCTAPRRRRGSPGDACGARQTSTWPSCGVRDDDDGCMSTLERGRVGTSLGLHPPRTACHAAPASRAYPHILRTRTGKHASRASAAPTIGSISINEYLRGAQTYQEERLLLGAAAFMGTQIRRPSTPAFAPCPYHPRSRRRHPRYGRRCEGGEASISGTAGATDLHKSPIRAKTRRHDGMQDASCRESAVVARCTRKLRLTRGLTHTAVSAPDSCTRCSGSCGDDARMPLLPS
jgi:hypothetical protein